MTEIDWLAVAALTVATVALVLWIADRVLFAWRIRRRPVEASFHSQQVKVREGEPVGWFVTVRNLTPRVLEICLGTKVTQPFAPEEWPTKAALGSESARRMSDGRKFQPVDIIELRAYDLDGFRIEITSVRPGTGSITPYLTISGLVGDDRVLRSPPIEFEVTARPLPAQKP